MADIPSSGTEEVWEAGEAGWDDERMAAMGVAHGNGNGEWVEVGF